MPAYWELAVALSEGIEEGLTNFLWEQGALGVVAEEHADERPRLRAFFTGDVDRARLETGLAAYLAGLATLGFTTPGPPRLRPLANGNWAEAWREHFRPVAVGRRLLVAPPWEIPAISGRLALVIEPGRAFGTGHHASTAGCLEALEALVEPAPSSALDLGTGSGILAIAAVRLGVGRVLAVDEDPDALAAATANAARNGVGERIECVRADAGALGMAAVPLVLANLLTPAHVRLAADYARYVAPGGALVLGGILEAQADVVTAALAEHGFATVAAYVREGWTTLVARRR
jgi:ribosomal protein L11 methyltransferase